MAREATRKHRRNWLIMLHTSLFSTIAFATVAGYLLKLASRPCPEDKKNALGQCVPYSTILLVLGPLFAVFACVTFVWLIVNICLRYSTWYSKGMDLTTEQVQWVGENRETCVINGDRYVLSGDWSKEKEKVLITENKFEAT